MFTRELSLLIEMSSSVHCVVQKMRVREHFHSVVLQKLKSTFVPSPHEQLHDLRFRLQREVQTHGLLHV